MADGVSRCVLGVGCGTHRLPECMDEDLKAALFEDDGGDFEELLDDFVVEAAKVRTLGAERGLTPARGGSLGGVGFGSLTSTRSEWTSLTTLLARDLWCRRRWPVARRSTWMSTWLG